MYFSCKISQTHIHLKIQHLTIYHILNETSDVSTSLKDTRKNDTPIFADASICFDIHTIKTSIEYSAQRPLATARRQRLFEVRYWTRNAGNLRFNVIVHQILDASNI